jgi:predicted translin family RNA/ssDNA-binding protein
VKSKIDAMLSKNDSLKAVGAFNEALQEYVEAVCYLSYIKGKELPSASSIEVEAEDYLMGLCDLTGELVRKAINSSIKEDYKKVLSIKDFVAEIYSVLMDFDFRSGNLRKKFDMIKYNVNRLEDIVFELKLKDKVK